MFAHTRFSKSWIAHDLALLSAMTRVTVMFGVEGRQPDFIIYDDLENMAAERPPEKPKADWEASSLDRLKQAKKTVSTSSLLDSLMQRLDA
jgi:hypothetical protein